MSVEISYSKKKKDVCRDLKFCLENERIKRNRTK